jgi:hypothetical protein
MGTGIVGTNSFSGDSATSAAAALLSIHKSVAVHFAIFAAPMLLFNNKS